MDSASLLRHMRCSISACDMPQRVAVAFSGGVDSSLVAQICRDSHEVTLLTIGFEGSHDVSVATEVSGMLGLPHHTLTLEQDMLHKTVRKVRDALHTDILSWHENCIAFHFITALAYQKRFDVVVTANGIDELFCGYDLYRRIYHNGSSAIYSAMHAKTVNEIAMLAAIERVVKDNGVRMMQPLLSTEFVRYSWSVPLHQKIRGSNDYIRKHAIRSAAESLGIPPTVCWRKKKAMQYGTRIHRNVIKFLS